MKKLIGLLSVLTIVTAANAGNYSSHSMNNNMAPKGTNYMTIEEVIDMPEGQDVVLRGIIQSYVDGGMYRFVDNTGSYMLEIDESIWPASNGVPKETVIIYGEVDDAWIDVDAIEVAM